MKSSSCARLAVCALLVTLVPAALAADPDEAKLLGKWTVESFDYNGNPVEMMKDGTREFKEGGKYVLSPKSGDALEGTYKVDSAPKPKTIDLDVNGRTLRGIYELEGDTLKMCYNLNDSTRPTEFASKPDTGLILVIHKRAK